jgi:hypothetical protein
MRDIDMDWLLGISIALAACGLTMWVLDYLLLRELRRLGDAMLDLAKRMSA